MDYKNFIDEKKAEFESNLLNKRMAVIKDFSKENIKDIAEECKKRDFDYIISQIAMNELELINRMLIIGFKVYGFPVVLKSNLDRECKKSAMIREYNPKDLRELKNITKGAFPNAHWYNNKNFHKENISNLYIKWLENSCNKRAEIVFVYEEKNNVLGYVSCRKNGSIGIIDLIAVSPKARKKGIGKALINAALAYFKDRRFNGAEVKTEITNTTALNLYTHLGFKISWVGLNINKWLE